jgi:hypothetical protein
MFAAPRIKEEFDIRMVIEHVMEYLKFKAEIKKVDVPVITGLLMEERL